MHFRSRTPEPGDLGQIFEAMWRRIPRRPDEPLSAEAVIDRWKALLPRWAITGRLVESPDLNPDANLLVAGLSAFVHESWIREYLRAPFPHPGRHIIEACAAGNPDDILLTDRQVAEANSGGGLHSVTLGLMWRLDRVPPAFLAEAQYWAVRSFFDAHAGYRLALILSESIGEKEHEMFLGSGAWQPLHTFTEGSSVEPPVLVGMARDEAGQPQRSASITAPLFIVREPRYCFEPGQQELLRHALNHVSDKDLAGALGIGPHALRRRWQRIFRRVQALQPPDDPVIPTGLDSAGKRARVLLRLSTEMHELRPHTRRRPLD